MDKGKKTVASSKKKVGKYIVDQSSILGKGQYGQVFKAQHQQTKQVVAVKTITKKAIQMQDEYTKNALIRQIQIMKNLQSPNIIRFVEIVQTANNIYIFQEIADGGTLGSLLEEKGRLKQPEAVGFVMQLLTGFRELANHGIIHRDIKPTNVLIKDHVLKIADFGMSRYSGKFSVMNSFVGTPYYMAPQILSQGKYTYKCDIWSLGVVFYEMVTGRIPWKPMESTNYMILYDKIKNICKQGIQFPASLQISKQYQDFVNGCLKFDQSDRFTWQQIFSHKLFGGKFQIFSSGNYNFTLTQLRKKIHSNNISLQKLSLKLPEKLTKAQFTDLLQALNQDVTEKQINNLFQVFSKGFDYISKQTIFELLKDHGIDFNGLKSKVVGGTQVKDKNVKILLHQLSRDIQDKQIDLFELYKKFDKKKQNKLQYQEFKQLIKSINGEVKDQEAEEIFKYFNINNTPSISFDHFYQNFCKAVQVPAVKVQKVSQGFKKMQQRKKGM